LTLGAHRAPIFPSDHACLDTPGMRRQFGCRPSAHSWPGRTSHPSGSRRAAMLPRRPWRVLLAPDIPQCPARSTRWRHTRWHLSGLVAVRFAPAHSNPLWLHAEASRQSVILLSFGGPAVRVQSSLDGSRSNPYAWLPTPPPAIATRRLCSRRSSRVSS